MRIATFRSIRWSCSIFNFLFYIQPRRRDSDFDTFSFGMTLLLHSLPVAGPLPHLHVPSDWHALHRACAAGDIGAVRDILQRYGGCAALPERKPLSRSSLIQ
jgi:hypothetical protein